MKQSCEFDPKRDIAKVSPNGALDLKESFKNNAVPANLQANEGKFNGIDDPSSISGRISDKIDAEMQIKQIREYKVPEANDE